MPVDHRMGFGLPSGRGAFDVPELVSPYGLHPIHSFTHLRNFGGGTAGVMPFLRLAITNSAMNSEPP